MRDFNKEDSVFDIVIKSGMIADGTGKPIFKGDIAIKGDEIVVVDSLDKELRANKIIDAENKIVSPGFIDIHTHIDTGTILYTKDLLFDRYATNLVMQGVTTVIGGNCGIGVPSIGEYLDKVNLGNTGPNAGLLVGHGVVRTKVIGMDNRLPEPDELEKMKALVREGMEEGAFGLSSGLGYSPGNYTDLNEMVELCKVVAEYDGYYTSHIRNQDRNVRESWKELIDTGKLSGANVHLSHAQVIGKENWGASIDLIDMLNEARNSGVNITCDSFPYEGAGILVVGSLIPNWVQAGGTGVMGGGNEKMKERLQDPNLLPKIKAEIADTIFLRGGADGIMITSCPGDPSIEQKYLKDIGEKWGLDPVDVVIKIAIEFDFTQATCFQSTDKDKGVFFSNPFCAVASDACCELDYRLMDISVQPRAYGTFPRFITEYVKEKKIVSLEEGIRKMTSLPAEILGIKDRGEIAAGKKADLVIFDLDKIADNATYIDSHKYPDGIEYVIINGKTSVDKGVHQSILSGVGLRGPGYLSK